jgi:TrmH RNA methyltransferase
MRRCRPHSGKQPTRESRDLVRIAGLAAVQALFATAPERAGRLFFVPELRSDIEELCRRMATARKPYRQVGSEELARVAGTVLHGGIVVLAEPRPVAAFDPAKAVAAAKSAPLLLCLDGVSNPHNLGAIARTAAFFGLDRMVLSDHPAQAGPSDAAHRVAEGGLEHVRLFRAQGFARALARLKPAYRVVGTTLERGRPLEDLARDRPIALVLGNEESGMSAAALAACDDVVTLAGSGQVQSLNVAATAAILIHLLLEKKTPPAPRTGGAVPLKRTRRQA